ncbi:probable gluconokinase isoform X1 [Callorhinchus milii]|uniref:probable gluconokinase isoform X1 n=1 Tax=Callorhinchus milii TaxID=7868 RepID=UPI0004574D59|nr:probable gluconokinase isoform X1 [Callorhinchus milii]|eukprot:gi/632976849/ref/XP_007905019.1/ PREDICTED: probable gluconokinase [Callorhinchus milii]
MLVVIMGVSGSGKTAVGSCLADKLGWELYDADDYHPKENKEKMIKGIPLNDEDRLPWLCILRDILVREKLLGKNMILACSALKRMYRRVLTGEQSAATDTETSQNQEYAAPASSKNEILFVYLHGSMELISKRLESREGHFMSPSLLQSQFDTLEPPDKTENFMSISVEKNILEIVTEIMQRLNCNL